MKTNTQLTYLFGAAFCLAMISLLLNGCASMGLQPAKSLDERIAYASASLNAVQATVAAQKERGAISKDEAVKALATLDQVHGALTVAQFTAGAGDITTAEGRLTTALSLLTELQTWLNERAAR